MNLVCGPAALILEYSLRLLAVDVGLDDFLDLDLRLSVPLDVFVRPLRAPILCFRIVTSSWLACIVFSYVW